MSNHTALIHTVAPRDEQGLNFSERELEIVKLLAEGFDVEIIAAKLFVSPYTVRAHKRYIFEKADVRETAELVNTLSKTGII